MEPSKPLEHTMNIEDSPRQFVCYSNVATVLMTPEEIVLHFGERKSEDFTKGTGLAKIYISLSHGKRLAAALLKSIKLFEEDFGEIPIQPLERLTPEGRKRHGVDQKGSSDE